MTKIFITLAIAVGFVFVYSNPAHAGGAVWNTDISRSASSATNNGTSSITISVHAYYYLCSQPNGSGYAVTSTDPNYCANNGYGTASERGQDISGSVISATGSGNTLSAAVLSTDSAGRGSFTIKSTVAETKTISITTPGGGVLATTTVTFTPPAQAPSTTPRTTTNSSTSSTSRATAPSAPSPTPTPAIVPSAPSLATITADGKTVNPADTTNPISVEQAKPFVLAGTTVPSGIVTLTIHSTPRTVTVQAGKDGKWSYTVTNLEPGNHYVEATVTDPSTNKTSDIAKLVSFTVTQPQISPTASATPSTKGTKSSSWGLISAIAIALIVLSGGGWYAWRLWRHKHSVAHIQNSDTSANNGLLPTAKQISDDNARASDIDDSKPAP